MKRLIISALILSLLPIFSASAAYTLDTIYGEYKEEEPPTPYILPNPGIFPCDPKEIQLSSKDVYFHYNENEAAFPLDARIMPLNARKDKITYSSSDNSVATVDENGNIKSQNKLGSAIITAKCGDVTSECRVSVIIGVTGVKIDYAPSHLYADKPVAAKLTASVIPENAGVKDIIWESSDTSIATVDRTGTVMPSGVGTVTITAKTKDKGLTAAAKIDVGVWEESDKSELGEVKYSHYNYTLDEAAKIQLESSPTVFTDNAYAADETDVLNYINPAYFTDDYGKYQFLDLSKENGIDAEVLNDYLSGKGILDGEGETFKEAAKENGISEVYLAVHACLETANGTSALANGIEYNGEIVYNMFGIGAIDSDPIGGGVRYAYENGWTTVEDAILGGARWISDYYINNRDYEQNTLYKMRWNPSAPGVHQYATDVAWAHKQAITLHNMFAAFPRAILSYEYPVYKGETEYELSD